MAEVILFHHALGLTPGIAALADQIRAAGHTVHTPDVYDGRTFATVDEGVAHARSIGFDEVIERGVRAADGLPAELVYAGVSLGVMATQQLAQNRPGARGALCLEAFVPPSEFGDWPPGVPVQIHGMDADPFFADEGDLDAARAFVDSGQAERAELFLYRGQAHLFCDSSLPSHDPEATAKVIERTLVFLAES